MTAVDTQDVIHLDFTPTLPCEHGSHPTKHADEPASWVARYVHPECEADATYLICESGRVRLRLVHIRCRGCGVLRPPGDGLTFTPLDGAS